MAAPVVVYDGRLPSLGVVQVSIFCIMTNLVLGWCLLLVSYVLVSRAAGSGEAGYADLK